MLLALCHLHVRTLPLRVCVAFGSTKQESLTHPLDTCSAPSTVPSVPPSGLPTTTPTREETVGQLETTFATDNQGSGNSFDLVNTGPDIVEITDWFLYVLEGTFTFELYYRPQGTALNTLTNTGEWTLLSSPTVTYDSPFAGIIAVPFGSLVIPPGETYGIQFSAYDPASGNPVSGVRYSNGGITPSTYVATNLSLTTYCGLQEVLIGCSNFVRDANIRLTYAVTSQTTAPTETPTASPSSTPSEPTTSAPTEFFTAMPTRTPYPTPGPTSFPTKNPSGSSFPSAAPNNAF